MTCKTKETFDIGLCRIDPLNMDSVIERIAKISESGISGYIVTPNIDHLQRLLSSTEKRDLRKIYENAILSLCDSRIIELILQVNGKKIPEIVTGSTLTEKLFNEILTDTDRVFVLGGSDAIAHEIRDQFIALNIEHHNPSMGFIRKSDEVDYLIDLICHSNPTHVFLAVGSPQQEIFAAKLCLDPRFKGVALCVGASLLFLVGQEKRAPKWLQKCRLEWLYRLLQSPVRLGKRYFSNALALPAIYWNIKKSLSGQKA